MIETYEYVGRWWLPEDEETKLAGTLTIARGGARLNVVGHFGHTVLGGTGDETVYSPHPADVPRILGETTNGKAITLETCSSTDFHLSFPGIATATYKPTFVLLDVWFTPGEEVTFDEIAIRTSDLDMWVGVSGIKGQMHTRPDPSTGQATLDAIDIHFKPPPPVTIPLDNGDEARVGFGFHQAAWRPVTTEMGITQTASLYFRFGAPRTLKPMTRIVVQARNFLSLAVGHPLAVLSVTGYKDDFRVPGFEHRQPIQILWQIPHNPEKPAEANFPGDMLFTLNEAKPSISEVMRAWFARQDIFKPVFNLYFAMLYHPSMYTDVQFLTFAQAIETYDFRRRDPHELSGTAHRRRIKGILDGAPEEWRDWLSMRLASSNYRTLDQRIRDVLGECPTVSARIVGATATEQNAFIRDFKNTRNYRTHYTPRLERRAAHGAELYLLIVQLRAIIEMSLLRELGFACDDIDRILDRVRRYAEIHHVRGVIAARAASGDADVDGDD